ncbi:hypothetical protein LTR53_018387, partial [Teratosphaeriaceae sp. CCFEE 6253]
REQITKRNVDLTWIFTQAIFMTINTTLWTLSFVEVRRKHCRAAVERHLEIAMEAIRLAAERWPGVASAVQLYHNLIDAVLKIYEKDGDVPIPAATPSDVASPPPMALPGFPEAVGGGAQSRGTSPATVSSASVVTPPAAAGQAPFGYFQQQARRSVEQAPPVPYQSENYGTQPAQQPQQVQQQVQLTPPVQPSMMQQQQQQQQSTYDGGQQMAQNVSHPQQQHSGSQGQLFNPYSYANPLPEWTPDLT